MGQIYQNWRYMNIYVTSRARTILWALYAHFLICWAWLWHFSREIKPMPSKTGQYWTKFVKIDNNWTQKGQNEGIHLKKCYCCSHDSVYYYSYAYNNHLSPNRPNFGQKMTSRDCNYHTQVDRFMKWRIELKCMVQALQVQYHRYSYTDFFIPLTLPKSYLPQFFNDFWKWTHFYYLHTMCKLLIKPVLE